VEDSCEHGKKPSGYIKCWEVLEQLPNSVASREVYFPICSMTKTVLGWVKEVSTTKSCVEPRREYVE
jgi:hypothetical protein